MSSLELTIFAADGAQLDQNAAAVAFKDRLVDYDRNARQRTTVVDDQNDYFEIDTNAWLDPEVSLPCTPFHCICSDSPYLKIAI